MTALENVRPERRVPAWPAARQRLVVVEGPARERHQLMAWLKREAEAGRVGTVWETEAPKGMLRLEYERLAERPNPAPWYVAGATAALGSVVLVGAMLWQARHALLLLAAVAAGALLLLLLATRISHSGGCVGLHCTGCKG